MRPIIFRGKDVKTGEWHQGGFTLDAAGHPRIITVSKDGEGLEFNKVIPETVGQYIGKTDKKKVPIFNDDIVKETVLKGWAFGCIGVARYDTEKCRYYIYHEDGGRPQRSNFVEKWETRDGGATIECEVDFKVIGNIHDNPELTSL